MSNVASIAGRRKPDTEQRLAPASIADKYPVVIGQSLNLGYISACFRQCTAGYRSQYVDLLSELLEKDPHAYSVVSKRVLTVGSGRLEIDAPELDDEPEQKLAKEVADFVQSEVMAIPKLGESLVLLAWATYYAVTAQEIVWGHGDDGKLHIKSLEFVHQRRISYTDPYSWDAYIWDQGAPTLRAPTGNYAQGAYGLRIADYPGQFVLHAPKVRGDYPTREGLGRELAYWVAIKNIATRLAPQYLERYAIPWPDFEYSTRSPDDEGVYSPRKAANEDIDGAVTAARAMGVGALSNYVHPDTIKVSLKTPEGRPTLTFPEWIALCDSQMSKAVLGATLTTEIGHAGGNRAAASVQKIGEEHLYEFDAQSLAETLRRDIVAWIIKINYPALPQRLWPSVSLHVNEDPDPADIIDRAVKASAAGVPVDADAVAKLIDVPVIPNPSAEPRRMIPIAPAIMTVVPGVIGLPDPPPPPEPEPGPQPVAEPAKADAPAPAEEPDAASRKRTLSTPYAARSAAFLADVRESRELGFEPDIVQLANAHCIEVPKRKR